MPGPNQIALDVYRVLSTTSGITNYVGTRIRPEVIKDSSATLPYIVYGIRNTEPENTKQAVSPMDSSDVIIISVHNNYSELSDLGTEIRTALDYYSNITDGISKIFFQTEDFEYDDDFGADGAYVLTQQFVAKIRR